MGIFSRVKMDVLQQMQAGKTVRETAGVLRSQYADKHRCEKEGYPALMSRVPDPCMNLESVGAIQGQFTTDE